MDSFMLDFSGIFNEVQEENEQHSTTMRNFMDQQMSSYNSSHCQQNFDDDLLLLEGSLDSFPKKVIQCQSMTEELSGHVMENIEVGLENMPEDCELAEKQPLALPKKTKPLRKQKKRKQCKPGYKTKNFLVNFKKSHFSALEQAFGAKLLQNPRLAAIQQKNGINMKDYEYMYSQPMYKTVFEEYFMRNQIYRDLMQSRVSSKTKKIYLDRLEVFEEAFRSGTFDRINY